MRIALVVHKFPPASVGGTEVYTLNLARELSRRGHRVHVFYRHDTEAPGGLSGWEDREGFRAFRAGRPLSGLRGPLAQFLDTFFNPDLEAAFQSFLEEARPEVVHFQHLMLLSYRLMGMVRRRGIPVLLTLHDYWYLCANSQLIWPDGVVCTGKALGLNCARCTLARSGLPFWQAARPFAAPLLQLRDRLVRQAALQAGRWVAPSRFLIDQYVRAGFPADALSFLENGLDVARIRSYAREESVDGRIRFTFLGSLAWQKGVHVLVEAFRGVPPDRALLRVYGDPSVFPEYAESLLRLADPSNTTLLGPVPNWEVGRVLANTDVLVVPSVWYENSPLVVQEAFAAGVPVLAADIGALTEKVEHGVSGWLCAPGNVQEWRRAVLRAIEQAGNLYGGTPEPLTIEAHVEALLNTYSSLSPVLQSL